ncbi:hypothetical protein [Cystobacter fuscus]|uniref:hypothetical protein n=1 Tax=Cystobacter fuscus TaxID=43 RepID=UPI002B3152A4|nr:hypothetical protein F0U63_12860 [Cystobacter fuscus]
MSFGSNVHGTGRGGSRPVHTPPTRKTPEHGRPDAAHTPTVLADKKGQRELGDTKSKDVFKHTSHNGTRVTANTTGSYLKVEGGAKVHRSHDGLVADLKLKIDANAIRAGTEVSRTFTVTHGDDRIDMKVKLGAETKVGADGELRLRLNLTPKNPSFNAGGEGFAGARGTLAGTIKVAVNDNKVLGSDIKINMGVGVGAAASLEGSLTHFKAKAFAAVGAGVGMELDGRAYTSNIVRATWDLAH